MNEWFRSPVGWTVLGFLGQLCFSSRFLVQWWASERERRVVIPGVLWSLSLTGGLVLLAYAVHRHDPVFATGQAAGLVIYLRNLMLHRREPVT